MCVCDDDDDEPRMDVETRRVGLTLLCEARLGDVALCRDVEADCRAAASTAEHYTDLVLRAVHNLRVNPRVGREVVHATDAELAEGTLIARMAKERALRAQWFENMLQEKYEALDDQKFRAIVRCRKCHSAEVTWDEKRTRSADEGATVFVTCNRCKNRWVLR